MDNYLNIDNEEVTNEDLITLIGEVYNDNSTDLLKELDEETIEQFAVIELSSFPTEITISAGMTRQKQQYQPNVYHASIKVDVQKSTDFIIDSVKNAPKGKKIDTYIKLKRYQYKSLLSKVDKHEDVLRRALIARAKADGAALPQDK